MSWHWPALSSVHGATDVIMPGISGIELSRRLFASYPNLAVLWMSGYAGNEITLLAERGDSVQFLQKPFNAVSHVGRTIGDSRRACRSSARTRGAMDPRTTFSR